MRLAGGEPAPFPSAPPPWRPTLGGDSESDDELESLPLLLLLLLLLLLSSPAKNRPTCSNVAKLRPKSGRVIKYRFPRWDAGMRAW
ncbi:MAG: hypothetical protein ACK4ZJ_19505, partial [Allorhizobium sp.]